MKTDGWIGSIVWGRIGGAVMILTAFFLQAFGIDFSVEDQAQASEAINAIIASIGTAMVVVSKVREKAKEKKAQAGNARIGLLAAICGLFLIVSCAGAMPRIQWSSPTQQQVAKVAVSLASKAIGLKLASMGFVFTPEIAAVYKMVTTENQVTLNTAQVAQRYIRENLDPLLHDDAIELAKMVGVEFDWSGNVASVSSVNMDLLVTAAKGLEMALASKRPLPVATTE